ncbi:hypothetical protein E1N66_10420 [Pantoea allii]|nr:hypothetical protein [Pantoea allii]THB84438.1 hypothetical protein E1N66_10420 [Pantoea allii]
MITENLISNSTLLYKYSVGNVNFIIEKKQVGSRYFIFRSYLNDNSNWTRKSKVDRKVAFLRESKKLRFSKRSYDLDEQEIIGTLETFKQSLISDYLKLRYDINNESESYQMMKTALEKTKRLDFSFEK